MQVAYGLLSKGNSRRLLDHHDQTIVGIFEVNQFSRETAAGGRYIDCIWGIDFVVA